MFELSDSICEAIIFAMEDQDRSSLVDLASGEVYPEDEPREGEAVEAPVWSSRDGYRLMETFLGLVRRPNARSELSAALSRGRGVFKAFKETLAAYPEVERAFRDYKRAAMGKKIRIWYDGLREAQGLERLGAEPEDTGDLINSDFAVLLSGKAECLSLFLPLVDEAEEEALGQIPEALARRGAAIVRAELEGCEWLGARIEDGEGGLLAAAAALREGSEGHSLGRIVFLFVHEGFRREGIARTLIDRLGAALESEGTELLVLDSPLLPPAFGQAMAASGFQSWGLRAYRRA